MVPMPRSLPEGVADTAVGAALMRARESERPDAMFVDPYAKEFVAAASPVFESGPTVEDDPNISVLEATAELAVAMRTRFFDDFVLDSVRGGCGQVVIVGAGLDMRAFRLDLPSSLVIFELDTAVILDFKEDIVTACRGEPRCQRTAVAANLEHHDWQPRLDRSGFCAEMATLWLLEGVLPYLDRGDAKNLFLAISQRSPIGSRLVLDLPELNAVRSTPAMREITDLWKGGPSDDPAVELRRLGWKVEVIDSREVAERYGRQSSIVLRDQYLTARRVASATRPLRP
jgi:methyltransferase (TIGR00027 family)